MDRSAGHRQLVGRPQAGHRRGLGSQNAVHRARHTAQAGHRQEAGHRVCGKVELVVPGCGLETALQAAQRQAQTGHTAQAAHTGQAAHRQGLGSPQTVRGTDRAQESPRQPRGRAGHSQATGTACALLRALCESVLLSFSESVMLSCSNSPSWPRRSRCHVFVALQFNAGTAQYAQQQLGTPQARPGQPKGRQGTGRPQH